MSSRILSFFSIFLFFNCNIFSQTISIEADYIAYDLQKNLIFATGNIISTIDNEILEKKYQLKINCNSMQIDVPSRKFQSQGNITITLIRSETDERISLQGDALFYNIVLSQGGIIKVDKKIEKIYFKGDELKPLSYILDDDMFEKTYSSDLEKSHLVLVCKKIQITFGQRMEAHQVSLWTRGVKTLSLPYYSTDFEAQFQKIPIVLKSIEYNSKTAFRTSYLLNYSDNKKFIGKVNFEHYQRHQQAQGVKKDKWEANLEQRFSIGKRRDGVVRVNKLGEKLYTTSFTYNHYINNNLSLSSSLDYRNTFSRSGTISLNRRFTNSNFSCSGSKTEYTGYSKTKTNSITMRWQKHHQFIEKTKLSYSTGVGFNNTKTKTNTTTTDNSKIDVNLDILRSALYVLPKLYINLGTSTSLSLSNNNDYSSSFRGNILGNYRVGKTGLISLGYNVSSSENYSSISKKSYSTSSKIITINTSYGKGNLYSIRLGNSYDRKTKKWGENLNCGGDVKLNKLLRTSISTNYNIYKKYIGNVNVSVYYNVFGERDPRQLQFYWYWTKPKNISYYITFNSMI